MKLKYPRHHLAAKLNLIAPSKPPQNALPKKRGMTQHVVGEVSHDCGSPATVTVKAIIKDLGLLNASMKGHAEMKCLKMTNPSPATRTACVHSDIHFDSASERVIDHFNVTSSIIWCHLSVGGETTVLKCIQILS